jgi:ABC-type sugar transport system ATPase subunit
VRNLSGGNQQKVVLAKWLIGRRARVLCSTSRRAASTSARKAEIYALMVELLRAAPRS